MRTKGKLTSVTMRVSDPYGVVTIIDFINEAINCYEVEKNAKNRAYSYILSRGLLSDYDLFCKTNTSANPHGACLTTLNLLAKKGKKAL